MKNRPFQKASLALSITINILANVVKTPVISDRHIFFNVAAHFDQMTPGHGVQLFLRWPDLQLCFCHLYYDIIPGLWVQGWS